MPPEALAAFIGAAVGSLLSLVFAGRTARAQAMNQQWAERRAELVEQLAAVISDIHGCMDVKLDIPTRATIRPPHLLDAYAEVRGRARLYLSDELFDALRPYVRWLGGQIEGKSARHGIVTADESTQAREMLVEAVEGGHTPRRRWYRILRRAKSKSESKAP